MERFWGYCQKGGVKVTTQGLQSDKPFQRSFTSCTVRVYWAGTPTFVFPPNGQLYSDNLSPTPTPLGNPFTANSDGYFEFYAAEGRYDIQLYDPATLTSWTWGDVSLCDPLGPNADSGCAPGVPMSRTISTTLPLTGGGDLSADRTFAINNFGGDAGAGGTKGAVPAPAAGDTAAGKYLKASGGWSVPPGGGVGQYELNCVGDGLTDDTACIQNAIDVVAAAGGGEISSPLVRYKINNTSITVKHGVTLKGTYRFTPGTTNNTTDCAGNLPCFLVYTGQGATTTPAFIVNDNSSIQGFAFFWPNQSATTPIQFGYAISTNGTPSQDKVVLRDLMLINPYLGIKEDFGGQWEIENIYGQPISVGIYLDRVYDVTTIHNVHFWDFWKTTGGMVNDIRANGEAFQIGKVDQLFMSDIFAYGYKAKGGLFHFKDQGNGAAWASINNFLGDLCTIDIEDANILNLSNGVLNRVGSTGITTGSDLGIRAQVNVSNTIVYAAFAGADITSSTGHFNFSNFIGRGGSDGSTTATGPGDLSGPLVINESTAVVTLSNPDEVGSSNVNLVNFWGKETTTVNGITFPNAGTDITPANFSALAGWTLDPPGSPMSSIPGGYRFDLNTAFPKSAYFLVPDELNDESGLFLLQFTIKASTGIGPAGFEFRLRDGSFNVYYNWLYKPEWIQNFPDRDIVVNVPLLFPKVTGMVFEWYWGGAIAPFTVDVTNAKIFRATYGNAISGLIPKLYGTMYYLDPTNLGMRLRFTGHNRETWQAAAPLFGTHETGDIVWNTNPAASGIVQWICTSGGTPGTWVPTVPSGRTISTTLPLTGGGDLSADRTFAINNFGGDAGAGGTKGAVPAPAAGDTAAGKFLAAGGGWSVPSGTGVPTGRTISTTLPLTGGGDLSANRTLDINNFGGDAGAGGTKGAVPAPAAGDAAADKFLAAGGGWSALPSNVALYSNGSKTWGGGAAFTWSFDDDAASSPTLAFSAGGVTLSAAGTNQNVTLTPSGAGYTVLNGHVGINAVPSASIQLKVFGSNPVVATLDSDSLFGSILQLDNSSRASGRAWSISSGNAANGFFSIKDETAGQSRIVIDASGYTGIGASSPASTFSVGGTTGNFQVNSSGLPVALNAIATVSNGIPAEYATVDLTAQGAAIGATTIYAVPAAGAGMYRVTWNAKVTTAGTTSSVLGGAGGFQVTYTDADDSVTLTPLAVPNAVATGNTTATQLSGVVSVNAKASTNLQYSFGYTDGGGATNMKYSLHIKVEKL